MSRISAEEINDVYGKDINDIIQSVFKKVNRLDISDEFMYKAVIVEIIVELLLGIGDEYALVNKIEHKFGIERSGW